MAAVDYFLKLDGIEGESMDAKHANWIDVDSWSWGENQPLQPASGGGAGAGKVHVRDFSFTTRVSKASPKLFLACASGTHLKEARLVGRKSGKDQGEFLTWTFSDVLVSSYETGGTEQALPMDAVSLNFSKVTVAYKAQKADGSLDAAVTAGWDVKANKKL
ncbi:MAG TPA: type VI secretion system tube protein Hcp [Solirubrobacteraceae bacterium]|nr:type VI secretion system tube protein Hcp [Solirubrobacteraceae bacterium]